MEKRSLLIGCGKSRIKQVHRASEPDWVGRLTTLDMNPNCGAEIVFDMESIPSSVHSAECLSACRLPFDDETFDELAAYNCMEHWGRQGDWRGYFAEMAEYHRILKPGGTFGIVVPVGGDALADPGHTRFFSINHFGFLWQGFYEQQEVLSTCFTDYRWFWKKNFEIEHLQHDPAHIYVLLRKA